MMHMHSTGADARPLVLAGFPAASWAFAIRTCIACLLALYAGFWLELDSASTAAITVAILALPTRGQGREKAAYRLLGTIIGVAASIVIASIFSQTDSLLLAVFGIWIGMCVYAAKMTDGNRAYAAALCCITVALIGIQQIDSPLQVFPAGIARGAAIAIGVLTLALVDDVLVAPDYHPVLAARLEVLHRRVIDFAHSGASSDTSSASVSGGLLHDIAALHSEIASLATESSSGAVRAAAARSAMVVMVSELFLVRALATLPAIRVADDPDRGPSDLLAICRTWLACEISRKEAEVLGSLQALQDGRSPARQWRAPVYRLSRIAFGTALRAALQFVSIASLFVMTGWPATELSLSLVAVIIGLSATTPDPRSFATVAVLAMPIACLLAGILKYLVLNGVSDFVLLAVALAPVIIGAALLISLPSRVLSPLGRLALVFTLAVLTPSNPQSYDPQTFLVTSLFAWLASVLVFAAQLAFPPLSNERRLRLLLSEIHHGLRRTYGWQTRRLEPEEATFRDAAWIGQIVTAAGSSASSGRVVAEALHCFDQAAKRNWCIARLDALEGSLAEAARAGRAALGSRNGPAIRAAAEALRQAAARTSLSADFAVAALVLASTAFDRPQPAIRPAQGTQP